MDDTEYYKVVFEKLEKNFSHTHYCLAAGLELIKRGWDPNGLLVTVEDVKNLYSLTCEQGMQIFFPLIESNSNMVFAPYDFEISLTDQNNKLYSNKYYQRHFFEKISPLIEYIEKLFIKNKLPFLLDLTPSGGHLLFSVREGTAPWLELREIGYLEDDLRTAYSIKDTYDIKRKFGVSEDAGLVFSGLGRLAIFIGLKAKAALKKIDLPITFCDSADKSINFDVSWAGDPVYMRHMRAPFSLHKKNTQIYGKFDQAPLVDVIKSEYDGKRLNTINDFKYLMSCMWNLKKTAAIHSDLIKGKIPETNDNLCNLIEEYKKSKFYKHCKKYDRSEDLPQGDALKKALKDKKLSKRTKEFLKFPNPNALQPVKLKRFAKDMLDNNYEPRTIGCIVKDLYQEPKHEWRTDWYKYPSSTRAHFWTRLYTGVD